MANPLNKEQAILRMQSLLDTARILNSTQDTNTILNNLLNTCLDLIPGGDLGFIFLYDETTGRLNMSACSAQGESLKSVSLLPGESMTGTTFSAKKSIFFKSNNSVISKMNNMDPSNLEKALSGGVDPKDINSSICCPLMYRDESIGVLVIDNLIPDTPLKEEDVTFLEDISVQATIALVNAQSLEKEKETNKILTDYTKIIENERNNYQYSLETHKRFTNMVLEGRSIKDIIMEASSIIERDIFLIDPLYTIRESTITSEERLNDFQETIGTIIDKLRDKDPFIIDTTTLNQALKAFPVIVNSETLAWLCVLAKRESLTELNRITIERTTTIIALEILKSNEIIIREQTLKGDFIESLINTPQDDYVKSLSQRYGLKQKGQLVTFTIKFNFESNKEKNDNTILRILNALYRRLSSILTHHSKASFALIKGSTLIVIVDVKNKAYKQVLSSIFKDFEIDFDFLTKHISTVMTYKIAVSQIFNLLIDFNKAYWETEELHKTMIKYKKEKNILYHDGLSIQQFLSKASHGELTRYVQTIFEPFEAIKSHSKEDFIKTLETYIKSNCNWTYTKDALHIHGNTLTYRLNRISEILKLDLSDYSDRLKLQVAYEIKDLLS